MASSSPELSSPDATPLESPQSAQEDEAFSELDRLTLREILDSDSRPTFVIDLDPDYAFGETIRPVFCNSALRSHDRLLDSVTGTTDENVADEGLGGTATYREYRDWATGISRFNDSRDVFPLTLHYQGLLWTGSTIRQRWRIISGNALFQTSDIPRGNLQGDPSTTFQPEPKESKIANPVKELASAAAVQTNDIIPMAVQKSESASVSLSKNTSKDTSGSGSSVTLATPDNAVPDWTVAQLEPSGIISEHIAFVRKVDWGSTPLGPMDNWSVQFREVVNLLMRNPHPASLFWGEELTMIYNEAYKAEVAGNKHPDCM